MTGRWAKINGRVVAENNYGEFVPAKIKAVKCFGVRHETTTGLWVTKLFAIRNGLALTGNRETQYTGVTGIVVAA